MGSDGGPIRRKTSIPHESVFFFCILAIIYGFKYNLLNIFSALEISFNKDISIMELNTIFKSSGSVCYGWSSEDG